MNAAQPAWRDLAARGVALQRLGQADDAAAAFARAVREPAVPMAARHECLRRMADLCLNSFGDAAGAALIHTRIAQEAGSASGRDAALARIVAALYLGDLSPAAISGQLAALAAPLQAQADALAPRRGSGSVRESGRGQGDGRDAPRALRLRVGLVSHQWCASPVAFLTLGALREMAREADLVFFDRGGKTDWAHAAFRELATRDDHWVNCRGHAPERVASAMREARLDALIDLAGWTDPDALMAVASRPAPRLLKWVGGQSATTGLDCFDAFVTDDRQAPPGCEALYREPLLRLPQGYVSYVGPPYARLESEAASPPAPRAPSRRDVFALVSNPVKIGERTAAFVRSLRPRRLLLVDHRWRHRQTRNAAAQRLGSLMDVAEFVTPADHPAYLDALRDLDATIVDTAPYSMGLTAIELRLLGKAVIEPPRTLPATMSELHCAGHLRAPGFAHHRLIAQRLLGACRR